MNQIKKEFRIFRIVYVVLVILILAGSTYIYKMIDTDLPDMDQLEPKITQEAREFALHRNIKDCIDESLVKIKPCKVHDLKCRITGKIFIDQCLKNANPVKGYCDAVPKGNEPVKTANWETHFCGGYPEINMVVCSNNMETVRQYCKSQ